MSLIADTMEITSTSASRAVAALQERVLALHGRAAGLLGRAPSPPQWAAARLRTVLPTEDLVVQAFRIQAEQLEANRRFTVALLEAWRPVTTKLTGQAGHGA